MVLFHQTRAVHVFFTTQNTNIIMNLYNGIFDPFNKFFIEFLNNVFYNLQNHSINKNVLGIKIYLTVLQNLNSHFKILTSLDLKLCHLISDNYNFRNQTLKWANKLEWGITVGFWKIWSKRESGDRVLQLERWICGCNYCDDCFLHAAAAEEGGGLVVKEVKGDCRCIIFSNFNSSQNLFLEK